MNQPIVLLTLLLFWGGTLVAAGLVWRWYTAQQAARQRFFDTDEASVAAETDLRDMHWIRRWLYRAGYRSPETVRQWWVATAVCTIVGLTVSVVFVFSGVQALMIRTVTLVPGGTGDVFLPMAYLAPWFLGITLSLLPWLVVRQRRRDRIQQIEHDLPLALELMATLSQAGLGFDAALSRVMETRLGFRPLGRELRSYQADIMAGRARSDCLRRFAWRADVHGVSILSSALVQADQVGMGIADVLRRQSEDLRSRRRERANMFAMGLATKRMFPLVICFLPGLFVWTLGPVFIQLIQMADTFTQIRNF